MPRNNIWLSIVDFFLFSSFFISGCAVLMAIQTHQLLNLQYDRVSYLLFIFFSTLTSYNFHWYLTPASIGEKQRSYWSLHHKPVHLVLVVIGLLGAAWFGLRFIDHWWEMGIAVVLTFLYSAPKIPLFSWLKKIAVGKTIFLSLVWTYATAIFPIFLADQSWTTLTILFCVGRFFLIYAICIVFDYRDREDDKKEGIKSLITYFDEKGIDILFYCSVFLSALFFGACCYQGLDVITVLFLLSPLVILLLLYKKAKRNFSDYLFDFVLDGLMAFSALLTLLIHD